MASGNGAMRARPTAMPTHIASGAPHCCSSSAGMSGKLKTLPRSSGMPSAQKSYRCRSEP
eukprot:4593963-Lingulodinium_polyedra.AAC.1